MNNKDRNAKPGDNEIVTKKGFLISPPKNVKPKGINTDFVSVKNDEPGQKNKIKKPKRHESFEQYELSRANQEKNNNENNNENRRSSNNRRKKNRNQTQNNATQDVQRNQSITNSSDSKTNQQNNQKEQRLNNKFNSRKRKKSHKNRNFNSKMDAINENLHEFGLENGVNLEKNSSNKSGHPHKKLSGAEKHEHSHPSKKDETLSFNKTDKMPKGNETILQDLGLLNDSFIKKRKFVEPEPQETDVVVDYSKAIPLRDQIYPAKVENNQKQKIENGCEIIGIKFKEAGKIYYFDPDGKEVSYGTPVIVETARGMEYGYTAISNRFVPTDDIVLPLKKIIRIATNEDKERLEANKALEKDAEAIFVEKTAKLGLEMELVGVEYTFDNTKLLFYFVAEGRVDFRELVKELASIFHTRIELRQVGVRDQAKMLGGLGVCGRILCCKTFLGEFSQVSIKMAKDQNLSLNSAKISGTCGRLLCCLRYEDEVYQKEYEKTPKVDAIVETPEGKGIVVEANPLKGIVRVRLDEKSDLSPQAFHRDSIKILGYNKKSDNIDELELKELEKE